MLSTPDQRVRAQIEAVKAYLRAEGFIDVEDPPQTQQQAFERHLHTIRMKFNEGSRILRLSYSWLEEHQPGDIPRWLGERNIGRSLREDPDATEVVIRADGMIHFPRMQFP